LFIGRRLRVEGRILDAQCDDVFGTGANRMGYMKTERRIESVVFSKIDPVDECAREAVRAADSQNHKLATPTGGDRNLSAVPGGAGILTPKYACTFAIALRLPRAGNLDCAGYRTRLFKPALTHPHVLWIESKTPLAVQRNPWAFGRPARVRKHQSEEDACAKEDDCAIKRCFGDERNRSAPSIQNSNRP
jgi:hypothetical protein